jgi:hypothetical protein
MPIRREKLTAFAYVEPRREVQGALLIRDLPQSGLEGRVRASWIADYPVPPMKPGDTVAVLGGQRPIAMIHVDSVDSEVRAR